MNHRADVLIITATQVESQAVINVFEKDNSVTSEVIFIKDSHYRDLGKINGSHVYMAIYSGPRF